MMGHQDPVIRAAVAHHKREHRHSNERALTTPMNARMIAMLTALPRSLQFQTAHAQVGTLRSRPLLLQGLLDRQGVRRQLHQPEEDLPQAAGVRVRCAVTRQSRA
jgi:hypothetical protein